MKASVFNLLNAVDDQNWDFWGVDWGKVSQGGLHTEYVVKNEVMKNKENTSSVKMP